MSEFLVYLELGITHILDLNGYDHILFLLVLMASFTYKHWKPILILITAFTLGHCVTLILSGRSIIQVNSNLIEVLIAVTILITAVMNLFRGSKGLDRNYYILTFLFGLIHGLGFSGYLKALLGSNVAIWKPLLYFNLGVEIGQLIFVVAIFFINYLFLRHMSGKQRLWNKGISLVALMLSAYMIYERLL